MEKIDSDQTIKTIKLKVVAKMGAGVMVAINEVKTNKTGKHNKMVTNSNSKMARRRDPHAHTARNMVIQLRNVSSNTFISERKRSMRWRKLMKNLKKKDVQSLSMPCFQKTNFWAFHCTGKVPKSITN